MTAQKKPFSWDDVDMNCDDIFTDEMLGNIYIYSESSRVNWAHRRPTVDPTTHILVNKKKSNGRRLNFTGRI